MRRILTMAIALTLSGAGVTMAQDPEQEREQERREQALQRVQEAQRGLERALTALREAQSDEARDQLERAMSELRAAQRQLERNRFFGRISGEPFTAFASVTSGPKMGVYLSTEPDPSVDSVGAKLDRLVSDGPAETAGLRAGDIITEANGESLARASRYGAAPADKLVRIKDDLEVGDTLHVKYRRGSETREADIVLDELGSTSFAYSITDEPGVFVAPRIRVNPPNVRVFPEGRGVVTTEPRALVELFGSALGWLDLELVSLDEALGEYFGTSEGLLVIRAPEDNLLNVRTGDVILNVDGRQPTSQSHLVRILRSYEAGETLDLEIMRKQRRQTVTAEVPEREGMFWRRERR
jgi:C-terminal processing protease CtpA/Prc